MEFGEEDEVRRLLAELSFEDQTLWRKEAKPFLECLEKYSRVPISRAVDGKNAIFIAEEEGKIIGLCWCTLVDRGIDRQGEISEFYIKEEHRGKARAPPTTPNSSLLLPPYKPRAQTIRNVCLRSQSWCDLAGSRFQ